MATLFSRSSPFPAALGNDGESRPRRRWFAARHGEPARTDDPKGSGHWLSVARGAICRIPNVRDFPIHCRAGKLWVTYPEYAGDTVLSAGERLVLTSRGTILVVALENSSIGLPEGFATERAGIEPIFRLVLRTG